MSIIRIPIIMSLKHFTMYLCVLNVRQREEIIGGAGFDYR